QAGGGLGFLWLFGASASVLMLPLAVISFVRAGAHFGRAELIAVVGSGVIHIFYFSLLQAGYRNGDLSIVYPVARGLGPLLSASVGIAILGDRPGPIAIAAGLVLLGGVIGMSGVSLDRLRLDRSVVFGLLCGVSIAAYTVWDRRAVATLELPAIFYYQTSTMAYTVLITPLVLRQAEHPFTRRFLRQYWRPAVLVAVLSSTSYSLVLHAMSYAPLSYVATLRESSILVATILGVFYLHEPLTRRKAWAAGAIVFGIIGLAVG
ncbi:MAG TPA: DMT family transporter, partial [Thermomicrobiales bacterium]|nr:DMT family transporter [Thermomicrobiales bacterium]